MKLLGCLAASTASIDTRRTVHFLGKKCTKVTKEVAALYLRQWQVKRCGFDMLFSLWLDPIMISTCCSVPMCSPSLSKASLLR
jgi:hypothetical protein